MLKLINGIIQFRKNVRPEYRNTFRSLALGQNPDVLMITCSDSRVDPGLFASTDPGDVFTVRNVGNLVPPCTPDGKSVADESEASAIEFAIAALDIKHIIICGHSECGAMNAICKGRSTLNLTNLKSWLRHGENALITVNNSKTQIKTPHPLSHENQVSIQNVLTQLSHLHMYPLVKDRLDKKELMIHAWWFEIKSAEVWSYRSNKNSFEAIDESVGRELIEELGFSGI